MDAALRITLKAMHDGTLLCQTRSDRLISLLTEYMRVHDLEKLLQHNDFLISQRSLLNLVKPLILSGKVEILSQIMQKKEPESYENSYRHLISAIRLATIRRDQSNSQLTPSEVRGFREVHSTLELIKLRLGASRGGGGASNANSFKVHNGEKENEPSYLVEDRESPVAPNLKMGDLTSMLMRQNDVYILYDAELWSNTAYRTRNGDIVSNMFKALRDQNGESLTLLS